MNEITILLLVLNLALTFNTRLILNDKRHKNKSRRVLLDTSVLIDGRILDLAKTGFISDELVITRSVIGELQLLADGDDSDKRTRARFGLDIINDLQKIGSMTVSIWPDNRKTPEGVDDRLLKIAKDYDFALATIDYNLNKVARVEEITVLNINELAKAIKTHILPGERIKLKLIQAGQSPNQAVGYLEDGSMIVVSDAKRQIGKIVDIEIQRYLQTDAGKMIFAELVDSKKTKKSNKLTVKLPKFKSKSKKQQKQVKKPNQSKKSTKDNKIKKTDQSKKLTKNNKVKKPKLRKSSNYTVKSKNNKPITHKQRQDNYLDNIINSAK